MPIHPNSGNGPLRSRRNRRQTRSKFKVFTPKWTDPHPEVEGTEPEKRVFACLLDTLHIYFRFQAQIPEFEPGGKMYAARPVLYKPDFVLPEYRLIIDPFGAYHHSREEHAKSDVAKVALYNMAGYAYYHPWTGVAGTKPGEWVWNQYENILGSKRDKEIRRLYGVEQNRYGKLDRQLTGHMNTLEMLLSIPEIARGPLYKLTELKDIGAKAEKGYLIGEFLGAGANSVGAANHKRKHPRAPTLKTKL